MKKLQNDCTNFHFLNNISDNFFYMEFSDEKSDLTLVINLSFVEPTDAAYSNHFDNKWLSC